MLLYYDYYLLELNCDPPPPPPPPGECPPMSFDEWKDWFYTNNFELYPQPYSLMLTYYQDYLDALDCETPTPPPPPTDEPDCPPMTKEQFLNWYYAQYPENYPLTPEFEEKYYLIYLADLDCPPTATPTPTETPTRPPSPTPTDTPTRPPSPTYTNTFLPTWTPSPTTKPTKPPPPPCTQPAAGGPPCPP
jgi:hypothetical protein